MRAALSWLFYTTVLNQSLRLWIFSNETVRYTNMEENKHLFVFNSGGKKRRNSFPQEFRMQTSFIISIVYNCI